MAKRIKYTGIQDRWSELSITGKQSVWHLNQQEERPDTEADLLLDTNLFSLVAPGSIGDVVEYADVKGGFIVSDSSTFLSGDSIMRYGNSPTQGSASISHVAWCNDLMRAGGGVGFDVVGCSAVGGATIDDLIALQLPAILASPARISWSHILVNNFNSLSAHNDSVAVMTAKLKLFLDEVTPVKDLVIIDFVNPVGQSGTTSAKGRAGEFPAGNAGILQTCSKYGNVIANDTYTAMVDPTSEVLDPLPNMVRADDRIHFVSIGAQASGYASFRNVGPRVRLNRYKRRGPNLLPSILGSGGAITGGGFITVSGSGIGTGWEVLGVSGAAATHSLVISDVVPGKKRLVFTNTGPSAATTYVRVSGLHTQVSGGMTVQGGFGFVAASITGLNRLNCSLRENGAAVWDAMTQNTTDEPTTTYPTRQHTGFRATPPHLLPPLTNYEYIIAVNLAATSGAATIDIFDPDFYVLS